MPTHSIPRHQAIIVTQPAAAAARHPRAAGRAPVRLRARFLGALTGCGLLAAGAGMPALTAITAAVIATAFLAARTSQ